MRRAARLLTALALAAAGVAVGLGMVEGGLRLYHALRPLPLTRFFWVSSAAYGWGLAPGREGVYTNDRGEFRTVVRINSKGLRDVERDYAKPPGVFRVLVLGDSYVEALQVALEETFGRRLEARLNERAGRRVEVVSAGVSAWGTDNALLFLRHEGRRYDPDLVLLLFTSGNDIRESYEPFNRMELGANVAKPHFTVDEAGRLELHPPPVPPPPAPPWWRERLYLGAYLHRRLSGQIALRGPRPGVGVPPPEDPNAPWVPASLLVYQPEWPPVVEAAYRVTQALIEAMREEAAAHGAAFAVVVHNAPWAHDDERWSFMCIRHPEARRTWDRRKPNRLTGAFLESKGIPFVDLFETFEAAKEREPLFFRFDPHWRPAGHRVAAEAAAELLLGRGLVPGSS